MEWMAAPRRRDGDLPPEDGVAITVLILLPAVALANVNLHPPFRWVVSVLLILVGAGYLSLRKPSKGSRSLTLETRFRWVRRYMRTAGASAILLTPLTVLARETEIAQSEGRPPPNAYGFDFLVKWALDHLDGLVLLWLLLACFSLVAWMDVEDLRKALGAKPNES